METFTLLTIYMGIPLESLVGGPRDFKLAPEKRRKLHNTPGI